MRTRQSYGAAAIMVVLLGICAGAPAQAQRGPYESGSRQRQGDFNRPGVFDYYALVLSWSPTYCGGLRGDDYEPQCHAEGRRPYAFVLHGLWPQYERGYPESCRTRERPYVPRPVINGMLDIMPSPRLVIHEFRKHGTCTGLEPAAYYDLARRLYGKINIPARFVSPTAPFFVGPGDVVDEFVAANPGLKPEMLAVECRGSGNRLREVRICFSREGEFRACGDNESPRLLCRAQRMYVPPVRMGIGRRSSPEPAPGVPAGQRAL